MRTCGVSRGSSGGSNSASIKPDCFLVGAPKCGTTAMADYLAAHPDVFMAKKEMHVFGSDLRFGANFYRRNLDAYMAEFKLRGSQRIAGEASVWYLLSNHAAAEIKGFNPDARIVIMLREPVEVLHSLYYQFLFDGNEQLPSFEQALAAETEREAGRRVGRSTYFPQGLAYRKAIRFTEQVKRYFDVFGRDRVHVVIYDDFAADPGAAYRGVLEFLGADATAIRTHYEVINANKRIRSPFLRVITGDPLVRSVVLRLRPAMPGFLFTALQRVEARVAGFNTRVARRPALHPDLRAQLQAEFAPEVERLSLLLNRDLTHWSRERPATEPATTFIQKIESPENSTPGIRGELSLPRS